MILDNISIPVDEEGKILIRFEGFIYHGLLADFESTANTYLRYFSVEDQAVIIERIRAEVIRNLDADNAASGFSNLPEWSTWTSSEAVTNVHARVFDGKTLAQVQSDIDALPNTVAGMKTGLKQAATAIIGIRTILEAIAKAIIYLRDLVVRFR